jgi:hypothetical protein
MDIRSKRAELETKQSTFTRNQNWFLPCSTATSVPQDKHEASSNRFKTGTTRRHALITENIHVRSEATLTQRGDELDFISIDLKRPHVSPCDGRKSGYREEPASALPFTKEASPPEVNAILIRRRTMKGTPEPQAETIT